MTASCFTKNLCINRNDLSYCDDSGGELTKSEETGERFFTSRVLGVLGTPYFGSSGEGVLGTPYLIAG
jgi:hypothetical protein